MNSFVSRLSVWVRNGSNYLLVLIPLILVIVLSMLLKNYSWGLNTWRVIGIFIEIFGLLTVVWSLSRESKKYDHPGYFSYFLQWVYEFKYVLVSRNTTVCVAGCTGHATFGGAAVCSVSHNYNTIEEKVEYLMQTVINLEKSIADNRNRVEQVKNELSTEIGKLNSTLQQEIVKIKDDLKDKATIDYYMLVSGALLTIIGMIMTNLPDSYCHSILLFA